MIKLVVTDLDGTLLNSKREISKKNQETIKKLQESGCMICFASGRPYQGIDKYAKEVNLSNTQSYLITNTGANVYDYSNHKLLYSNWLDMSDYNEISKYMNDCDVQIAGYTDESLYCFSKDINPALIYDKDLLGMDLIVVDATKCNEKFCRFNVMGEKEAIDQAILKLPQDFFEKYYTVRNESFSFEILNKHSGKKNALLQLVDYLGLDLETEVVTIGDNYNDAGMLSITTQSIAMGQSNDDIKNIAKYVTLSNDEDGFSSILNDLIIKQ